MAFKKCVKCGYELEEQFFHGCLCMTCHSEKRSKYKKGRKNELRRRLYAYLLMHPCVDCFETDPVVLTFDHVLGKKWKDVGRMIQDDFAWDTIVKEIAKCQVRCANCHHRKTAKTFGWYKDIDVMFENSIDVSDLDL